MNVVIYARFSSHSQNEQSIEGQLKACYEFAQREGYIVIGEYIDRAVSGKTDNRPQLQKMIADSAKRHFEAIIVYQLDRFARNRYDSATNKAKLKKNGVRVLSARENITDDASGVLIEGVLESMAEYYSAELSQKVRRGMDLNAEKHLSTGGNVALGYRVDENKRFQIDESTAPTVVKIFEMYASGHTIKQITDYMNSQQIKTSTGAEFNKNSLRTMLANRRYIGFYTYKDTEIKDGMPRIVSDEVFYKVQDILQKNKKAPARAKADIEYLLTTKLFCGHCKSMMTGISGTGRNGTLHYYYTCNNAKKKLCKKKNVKKDYIEDIIIIEARKQLTDENIAKIAVEIEAVCEREKDGSNIKRLKKQISEIDKAIENLMKALEQGQIADMVADRIAKKREERADLEKALAMEQMQYVSLSATEIMFFLTRLKNGDINDMQYRKMLITVLVNSVYLYDDGRLTIVFNATNGTVSVDMELIDEIESGSFLDEDAPPTSSLVEHLNRR